MGLKIAAGLAGGRKNLPELAKRDSVYCKISGSITQADWETWSKECLRLDLDCRWLETLKSLLDWLSATERERILGETAIEIYRLHG